MPYTIKYQVYKVGSLFKWLYNNDSLGIVLDIDENKFNDDNNDILITIYWFDIKQFNRYSHILFNNCAQIL